MINTINSSGKCSPRNWGLFAQLLFLQQEELLSAAHLIKSNFRALLCKLFSMWDTSTFGTCTCFSIKAVQTTSLQSQSFKIKTESKAWLIYFCTSVFKRKMTHRNSEEMNIDFNSCFYADKHKPIHVCMHVVQKESTIELTSPKTHALKRCHQVFTYSSSSSSLI